MFRVLWVLAQKQNLDDLLDVSVQMALTEYMY